MKVHIIGISGKTSSAIATMFLDMGWKVTGSDQGVYPPASDYLTAHTIPYAIEYAEENLDLDTDLVIVAGNALIINPQNPEYLKAKKLNIPVKTFPQVLGDYVIKENSIVVVGNYGKGTISGALMHALTHLQQAPSYMIGGQVIGYEKSISVSTSPWSVVEGDEYPTPPVEGELEQSKFFYYHPKYLVLTSAEWDHYDKFPTETAYVNNFIELVKTLPPDGLLVANKEGKNIDTILPFVPCKVITYGSDASDYPVKRLNLHPQHLFGSLNFQNLTAAYALLSELGFNLVEVQQALESYQGLEYRLQKVFETPDKVVIRDLAHSPVKAQATLQAIKAEWPHHTIVSVFEAFSSSLKTRDILPELQGRFTSADLVLIPKVDQIARIEKENRVTGKEITEAIGTNALYLPKDELLLEKLQNIHQPAVVVFMSSGGIRGIPQKYIEWLQKYK